MIVDVPGASVDTTIVDDPLLGPAHVITSGDRSTTMSAIDWSRPTTIPTIAAPAVLAPGSGGALMNLIATRARDAGVQALRYAGRYPTAALFRTLLRSFRTSATEEAFTSHFRFAGDTVEIPIDFLPAPFMRRDHAHGFVEMRDEIERAVVDGVSYERGSSPARLVNGGVHLHVAVAVKVHDHVDDHVHDDDNVMRAAMSRATSPGTSSPGTSPVVSPRSTSVATSPPVSSPLGTSPPPATRDRGLVAAEVWFGDACYARVATFDPDGTLVDGPHPIPACTSDVIDKPFPPPLVAALAELVADAVPAPIADDARAFLAGRTIRWADLGARAAKRDGDGFAVHAALWDRIAPLGLARLALALAEAMAPVVTQALVAALARDVGLMSHPR